MQDIQRSVTTAQFVTFASGATLSSEVRVGAYAGGVLQTDSAWDGGSVMSYKHRDNGGNFWLDVYDKSGSAAQTTGVAASRSAEIPEQVMLGDRTKLVTNTAVGGERTVRMVLKG